MALLIGATFAYFTVQGGDPRSANLNVTANTTDGKAEYSAKSYTIIKITMTNGVAITSINWLYLNSSNWTISRDATKFEYGILCDYYW